MSRGTGASAETVAEAAQFQLLSYLLQMQWLIYQTWSSLARAESPDGLGDSGVLSRNVATSVQRLKWSAQKIINGCLE